jgi:hypothetical protein
MYEVMWENNLEPGMPQMTIWREDVLLLDAYTRSQYVIVISFPLKQGLHERASMLRFYVQGGSNMTGTDFF